MGALRRVVVAAVAVTVLVVAGAGPAAAGGNGRGAGRDAAERPRQHAMGPSARGGQAQRPPARVARAERAQPSAPVAQRGHRSRPHGHQATPRSDHRGRPGAEHQGKARGAEDRHDDVRIQVLGSSAARPTPVASPAPVPAPARPAPAPQVAGPPPARVGPQQLVGPLAPTIAQLDPPVLASPTFVERAVERFPDIPPLPTRPGLIEDPAFPLVLVALLGVFLAITGRGDRRDPKLTKAELDARGREIGFS